MTMLCNHLLSTVFEPVACCKAQYSNTGSWRSNVTEFFAKKPDTLSLFRKLSADSVLFMTFCSVHITYLSPSSKIYY